VAREETPIQTTFARLLNISQFQTRACAVAYIGWTRNISEFELDAPIALCEHLLIKDGEYNCNIGRWSTSSSGDEGAAKWTDFSQSESGCGAADASTVGDLVDAMDCGGDSSGINPGDLQTGTPTSVSGEGIAQVNLTRLFNRWKDCDANKVCADGDISPFPTKPWPLRLPVVECDDSDDSACNPLVSGVTVEIIWQNNLKADSGFPECMEGVSGFPDWDADTGLNRWGDPVSDSNTTVYPPGATGDDIIYDVGEYEREEQVWDSFVRHFGLTQDPSEDCTSATDDCGWWEGDIKQPFADNSSGYRDKAIYFSPACEGLELGGSGGTITFSRAKVPVLVY
jgi:hypothetical protein